MKRILIIETGAGFGGALTSLESLLSRLDPGRFEVHLLTSYPQDLIVPKGAVRRVGVLPRQRRYGSDASLEKCLRPLLGSRAGNAAFLMDHLTTGRRFASAILRYVRENGMDILQGNNGILINDAVILAAKRARIPCVIHARSAEYPGRVGGWLAKGVSRVLAVSRYVAQSVSDLGYENRRIALAPEGLDADGFAAAADHWAFRRRHGLPRDVPLVGLVACLVPWKGQEVFLKACARALDATNAQALVVGGEPDGSGRMLAGLRNMARDLGIENKVCFTGHETDVASAMAACQVVVHASTGPEPFGRVILEAMALGRPVIATMAGGPMEIIDSGRDGLLVPPGQAEAMAEAIRRLLGDEDSRNELGAAGWKKVRDRYGIQSHAAAVEAVWDQLPA